MDIKNSFSSTDRSTAMNARLLRWFITVGMGVTLGASPIVFAVAAAPTQAGSYAKGRILVMPRPGLPDADFAKIVGLHGGKAKRIGSTGVYTVDLPENASEEAVASLLAHNPHIKFAELDHRGSINFAANDPYLGSEWHIQKIGAPSAWDSSQGLGVTIAILDTGVDGAHPDLASQMVPGWDFVGNSSNTSDVMGHGTKVAGSAAAMTNNSTGVSSVSGQSRLMPIRVADASGYFYYSNVANGISYAADHGARVASISLEGMYKSLTIQNAAQYMKSKGGLVIVSAGNNGVDENATPTTTMIPVSATDGNDALASWSSYGNFVALSAPGVGIWTTTSGGGYGAVSGTSFSSPITAAVAALMMAANPKLSNTQIETLLYSTAVDLGSPGRDPYFGYGRVNAAAAVQAALATSTSTPTADTQPPSASITAPLGSSTVSGLVSVNVTAADNIGVTKVELRANGSLVGTDTTAPYGFSWNSASVANGSATLTAYSFDAAGNSSPASTVMVNVSNNTTSVGDTTAPVISVQNPLDGSHVSGVVSIVTTASDNSGSGDLVQSLTINGVKVASGIGSTLTYKWNTRKQANGSYVIEASAVDAAGNRASRAVQVIK